MREYHDWTNMCCPLFSVPSDRDIWPPYGWPPSPSRELPKKVDWSKCVCHPDVEMRLIPLKD